MQAERDHLKNIVFPRIEEELRKKRIRLETVDLRWGVDTTSVNEDEREATVLKVCLEEIERCKPFFIGLLGDRYGWVPPEERIANATAGRKLILPNKGKSVTALEIEFGVLASTENLNRSIFYLREPLPYDKLSPEKAAKFCDQYDLTLSQEEKESRKEVLKNLKDSIKSHFDRINLPGKVKPYSTGWSNDSVTVVCRLEPWGEMVFKDILAECENHAEDTWGEAPKDQHEQQVALLEAFIEEHTHISTTITEKGEEQVHTFCGRKKLIRELREHLLSNEKDKWGLVLTGESGLGKSAIFSMMYKIMMNENCLVLAHSAGISPDAKNLAELLRKWNRQFREFMGIKEEEEKEKQDITGIDEQHLLIGELQKTAPKLEIEKLEEQFAELLQQASEKKRIIMLIDALDRFEPTSRAQYMTWLPIKLPENVRFLVTAITGTEKNAVQYNKGLITHCIDHFTEEEAREMLYSLVRRQHKSLPKPVEKEILGKKREDGLKACSSPLWLSLAVNILMAMDEDDFAIMSGLKEKGNQQIESYMLEMVKQYPVLPGELFLNLIEKAGGIFGDPFTMTLFNFIACSRGGLRESDFEILLPEQISQTWDPLNFAGLRRWFRMHLVEQGEGHQWNLTHSILRGTLLERLRNKDLEALYNNIALHLAMLQGNDPLQVSETMYYWMKAGNKTMAALWYGSYGWNKPQTEGSSKIIAEEINHDEAKGNNNWLEWVISLLKYSDSKNLNPRTIAYNFIFSLFDHYFQNNTSINTRLKLIMAVEARMEELYYRKPDSADYARDLSVSYNKLGDLYFKLDDLPKALDKYQASLNIVLELHNRIPNSLEYTRDLSINYERLGDLFLKLGDKSKAIDKFQLSFNIREELCNRVPDSTEYTRDLSVSYNKLGNLYIQLGDIPQALDKYEASLAIVKELYTNNPNSVNYAYDLSVSYNNLGDLYLKIDDFSNAVEKYKASLNLQEELRSGAPDSMDYADALSNSYERLGTVYFKLGDTAKAIDKYQASLIIREELRRRAPYSADYVRDLSVLYNKLGDLYFKLEDLPKALDKYHACLDIREELSWSSPDSADYARDLSVSYNKLGDLYLQLGDPPKALDKYKASLNIREELRLRTPDSVDYAHDLSVSYNKLGDLYLQLGDPLKALEKYKASLNISEELRCRAPDSADYARNLSVLYNNLGDLYLKLGDLPKALNKYQASLNISEELRRRTPDSADYTRDLVVIYYKILSFYQKNNDQQQLIRYSKLCKEALLYMKNNNMFMDEPLKELLNYLEQF